ncbi:ABC transporter permease [Gordonia caeni]|uniref:Daunorubicin ABC transporter ATP-binding protein DrrA n=1 Tax=Gordonia caeni TaxID=1007097 RepID=A0ABP7PRK8_9ACTN
MSTGTLLSPPGVPVLAAAPGRARVPLTRAVRVMFTEKARAALRSGDLLIATASPLVFFACFYIPLHRRFELGGGDYAQFLTPIILLQAALFTAIAATEVAGADARAGVAERFASLPMPRTAPLLSRIGWAGVRMSFGLAAGLLLGWALGFGFHGGVGAAIAFVVVPLVFAIALSMLTDAAGTGARDAVGVAHVLMIPQLILTMASTGLVPAAAFPEWVQPFVRNQPMSILADTMRALSDGSTAQWTAAEWTAPLAWLLGLLAAGVLAVVLAGRRQVD